MILSEAEWYERLEPIAKVCCDAFEKYPQVTKRGYIKEYFSIRNIKVEFKEEV